MNNCSNCDQRVNGAAKYCFHCGQSLQRLDKPFKKVCQEVFHELLDIDGRLALTIKTLIFKPGLMTLEFNQGKRVKYTPPLRMYLVVSILFFLVVGGIGDNTFVQGGSFTSIEEQYPRIMFALLPAFAGLLQLFYLKTYYISNLVFAVHIHSFCYLLLIFILPLETLADENMLALAVQLSLGGYLLSYLLLAMKNNYQQGWGLTLFKFFSIMICYVLMVIIALDVVQHLLA